MLLSALIVTAVVVAAAYFFLIQTTRVDKNEDGREAEERVHEIEDSVRGELK